MAIRYFLALLLALFSMQAYTQENKPHSFNHSHWNALLKKHVVNLPGNHATQVDYTGINSEKTEFNGYLKSMSGVSQAQFDQWTKQEQLAFLINAYNAWTVKLILSNSKKIKSIKDIGNIFQSPWKKPFIPLFGSTLSLDDIEHGLIRDSSRYNDFRIHFAVNCASIGCPALRNEAYTAVNLNSQLEDQTRRFLSDKSRNRFENGVLNLSPIFKWYANDFQRGWLGVSRLTDFLSSYAMELGLSGEQVMALNKGKIEITYLEYDWNLNGIAP